MKIEMNIEIPEGWEKWDGVSRTKEELRGLFLRNKRLEWSDEIYSRGGGILIQRIPTTITIKEIIKQFKEQNKDIKILDLKKDKSNE